MVEPGEKLQKVLARAGLVSGGRGNHHGGDSNSGDADGDGTPAPGAAAIEAPGTEEAILAAAARHRDEGAARMVDAMFEARGREKETAPDDQSAFVLRP